MIVSFCSVVHRLRRTSPVSNSTCRYALDISLSSSLCLSLSAYADCPVESGGSSLYASNQSYADAPVLPNDDLQVYGIRVGTQYASEEPTINEIAGVTSYLARQKALLIDQSVQVHRDPATSSPILRGVNDKYVQPTPEYFSEPPKIVETWEIVTETQIDHPCDGEKCVKSALSLDRPVRRTEVAPGSVARSWLKVVGLGDPAWLPIDASTASFDLDLGTPFQEVLVEPRAGAPVGLPELKPLEDAVSALGGKSLSWASVARPPRGSHQIAADQLRLMEASVSRALELRGLSRDHMTFVEDDPNVPEGRLRVRLFAKSKEEESR